MRKWNSKEREKVEKRRSGSKKRANTIRKIENWTNKRTNNQTNETLSRAIIQAKAKRTAYKTATATQIAKISGIQLETGMKSLMWCNVLYRWKVTLLIKMQIFIVCNNLRLLIYGLLFVTQCHAGRIFGEWFCWLFSCCFERVCFFFQPLDCERLCFFCHRLRSFKFRFHFSCCCCCHSMVFASGWMFAIIYHFFFVFFLLRFV